MGGLSSVASTAIGALSVANSVMGGINSYQENSGRREYDQQRQKNDLDTANAMAKAENDKYQLRIEAEMADKSRRDALRRNMARQLAKFGASGTDASTGSGQAVLLGMFEESEADKKQRDELDALKASAIDRNMAQQQRVNTLQLTQLKEKDKYNRYTSGASLINGIGKIFG